MNYKVTAFYVIIFELNLDIPFAQLSLQGIRSLYSRQFSWPVLYCYTLLKQNTFHNNDVLKLILHGSL